MTSLLVLDKLFPDYYLYVDLNMTSTCTELDVSQTISYMYTAKTDACSSFTDNFNITVQLIKRTPQNMPVSNN